MGLLDKLSDMAVGGLTEAETVRITYSELAGIVKREFVDGADTDTLKKVIKTAKGGFFFNKEMKSKNGRYDFHVGTRPHGLVWLASKPAWIYDNEENKFYQLDKDIRWKKFYNAVATHVNSVK